MPTTFDELLLDPYYSAFADGGPEFATAIVRSGEGGSIAHRAANREDFVSRYEIEYAELERERQKALRSFGILRQGMARGFRFLPPDDSEFELERVGVLNASTGEVEPQSDDGTETGANQIFYLIRHYEDAYNSYTRRIVKPSPLDVFEVSFADAADPENILQTVELNNIPGADGELPQYGAGIVIPPLADSITFQLNYFTGGLGFASPLPDGLIIYVTGKFHLPVAFTSDWHKFRVDESSISEFRIGVEEILPVEIGII